MGREVRLVPRGWKHPSETTNWRDPNAERRWIPKKYGWDKDVAEFQEMLAKGKSVEYTLKYFGGLCPHDYMDADWADEGLKPELLCMYEDTSEGTPLSPAFETPEELARWLADNGASAFAKETASYDQWLSTIKRGHAVSAVLNPKTGEIQSGVAALAETHQD